MLDKLSPPEGSRQKKTRVGRGPGSRGKTSGRGHKGQKSRSGGKVPPWFEGGQTPLKMRVPKRGFTSRSKTTFDIVNVDDLNRFSEGDVVTPEELERVGLVSGKNPVKILGDGELKIALTVRANKFSAQAEEKIAGKGGEAQVI